MNDHDDQRADERDHLAWQVAGLFRELSTAECEEFRAWARANYVIGAGISPLWHPGARDECRRMNEEAAR